MSSMFYKEDLIKLFDIMAELLSIIRDDKISVEQFSLYPEYERISKEYRDCLDKIFEGTALDFYES